MMSVISEEDVVRVFQNIDQDMRGQPDLISECVQVCLNFGLSPEDLCRKWETFAANNSVEAMSPASLEALKRQIQLQTRRAKADPVAATKKSDTRVFTHKNLKPSVDYLASFGVSVPAPSQSKRTAASPSDSATKIRLTDSGRSPVRLPTTLSQASPSSAPSKAYSQRGNKGKIVANYAALAGPDNTPLAVYTPGVRRTGSSPFWGEISIFQIYQRDRYKYMFQKMNAKADVLDQRLEEMALRFTKKLQKIAQAEKAAAASSGTRVEEEESTVGFQLANIALAQQSTIYAVGRICCDSEGRLNEKSLLLEGSQQLSNRERVPLNVDAPPSFSFFPGQIVGVVGTNPTGNRVVVQQLLEGVPLPQKKTDPQQLVDYYYNSIGFDGGESPPVSVFVASGPFTCGSDLSYAPLADLLAEIQQEQPDVLILTGPFVDAENSVVEEGELTMTIDELAQQWLSFALESIMATSHTQVVVIPSLRDAAHVDAVFPQPPYHLAEDACKKFEATKRVFFFPNPSMLLINEIVIGVSTNDILFHIGQNETGRTPKDTRPDRLSRLAAHLIDQKSFYPLFPPAVGANVDYEHVEQSGAFAVTPDVLLLPSDLTPFAKEVRKVLCVNPGKLAKGNAGGTYARMAFYPPRREDIHIGEYNARKGGKLANLYNRCAVSVLRV